MAAQRENFSVLISVYWAERVGHLRACFESLESQTIQQGEVVLVIDGHVPAQLRAEIMRWKGRLGPMMTIVELEKNSGLGVALQAGLKRCRFNLVARMDADDLAVPDRFEKQLAILHQDKNVDVIGSYISEFDRNPREPYAIRRVPTDPEEVALFARKRNPMNHMTVMFRKSAVLAAGGYITCHGFEDYWLWARMLLNGSRIANIPESLVLVRAGSAMIRRRGGIRYFVHEVGLQRRLLDVGFLSRAQFIGNVIRRGLVRMLPGRLREFFYASALRARPVRSGDDGRAVVTR